MKKVVLLSFAAWIGNQLVAQQNTITAKQPSFREEPVSVILTHGNGVVRRDAGNAWYQTTTDARNAGETFVYYGDFISWPDSLPIIRYSNGPQHAFCHGFGACLDPKADYYSPALSRYQYYTIDTFFFFYKYFNPVPSHTDSLIIQVYDDTKFAQLNFGSGNPTYSPELKGVRGVGSIREYHYLLDTSSNTADFFAQSSASFSGSFVQPLTPPVSVRELDGAGTRTGLFGFTTYLKPNYSYKFGDTMIIGYDTQRSLDPVNKISAMQPLVLAAQTGLEDSKTSFNYLLANYTNQRYSTRTTEWFYPGNPPSTNRRYLAAGFHLNYFNLGTRFQDMGADLSNIYPNPAKENGQLSVDVKLKNAENVKIEIYNTSGQMVKSIANNQFGAGKSTINFNVDGIAAGTYYVKMTGSFGSVAQTLLVK